ncbi:MAG TPA: aminotransferase class III, partial [Blastocatellia bacterium]|nr:aminotransferase class III [Blastocatellia bacterium]
LGHFGFTGEESQAAHTLFTQLMLDRGYLATKAFYATYAHNDSVIDAYLVRVEETFGIVAQSLKDGSLSGMLRGPVAHRGFHRLT